jgi:Spy/CpxP family protein refolding chaperone
MTTSQPRLRGLIISLLVLTFIAGASAGIAGDRLIAPQKHVRVMVDMSGVFDRLGLTAEQRRQADSIVERSAPRAEAIMIETAERLRSVADSVDSELREILTPEQRARLDELKTDQKIMLKRKLVTPGGTKIDTVFGATTGVRPRP